MTPEALILNLQEIEKDVFGDGQDISIVDVPELLADFLKYDGNGCFLEDVKFIDLYINIMTTCGDTYLEILNTKWFKKHQDKRLDNLKRDIKDYLNTLIHYVRRLDLRYKGATESKETNNG